MQTRQWARTVPGGGGARATTTYTYNHAGEMSGVIYNDPTPATAYHPDRRGRTAKTVRNGMTTTLSYNDASQLLGESYSGGTLGGLSTVVTPDAFLRRQSLQVQSGGTPLFTHTYGYDNGGRLQSVSDGTHSATYAYLANSPLVSQITFRQGATTRMTTTKQYDKLNRLQRIASVPSASSVVSFDYFYNSANQRIRSTLGDGSYWVYDYDSLGQVKSGKRHWSDGTPVAGQQFEYGFDDIGNRATAKNAGDESGAGLRPASYTPDRLNQYASRTVPAAFDVLGAAKATASITVNGTAPYRHGEYFRKEITVANGGSAVSQGITTIATEGANQQTSTGNQFVPQTPEQFTHDLDGNLTADGRWTYEWDGENRLLRQTARFPAITPPQRLDFECDWQGRRIAKRVWNNTGGTGVPALDERFLYDGWNLAAQLNATNNAVIRSFVWGSDLSGSLQGAGGVGGLLMVSEISNGQIANHFPCYDGNGNVAALVRASDGTVSAQYEHGPFGELLRATGPLAFANPFRFSTKFQDDETGLLYYGYRYYDASTGRWPNRDPIGEKGGLNLYGFVGNNSLSRVDALGLYVFDMQVKAYIEGTRVAFGTWTFNAGTKVDHVAHVDTDAESLTQTKFIGTTIKYDSSGNEVDRATASSGGLRAYIRCKKISTRVGCCKECHIQMIGTASDPLFYGAAPPLDYDFFVSVTVCPGSIYFYYSGSHDGYPSYDFNLAGDQVHHFSHVAAGTSPLSLYSWGQYYFHGDKWLMTGLGRRCSAHCLFASAFTSLLSLEVR